MNNVKFDFGNIVGAVKPMHAVNNGPVYKFAVDQRITNMDSFRAAGIPYARNHDASFCATYGGEHIVDVAFIFTDFDKDPYDPASYDFTLTDEYLRVCEYSGTEVFYRLGSKIEHWAKKYNTLPPKDFKKWAVICEHIIRHYCYGWADGYHMNIKYWEIWNEPDLDPDDSTHKRCWGGTAAQFYELFAITLDHLKDCFPELKIGGPAVAKFDEQWCQGLVDNLGKHKPDFFSWHIYAADVAKVRKRLDSVRSFLDRNGLAECESILNEWNYVRGWEDEEWIYSLKTEKNIKGASFIGATMIDCQKAGLDMLMYYDARPGAMNGLYSSDLVCEILKGYYPFYSFNKLYGLGCCVASESDDQDVYSLAATGADGQYAMLVHYSDNDDLQSKRVRVSFTDLPSNGPVKLEYYLLDKDHDLELVREEIFASANFAVYVDMPVYTTYLLKITPFEE